MLFLVTLVISSLSVDPDLALVQSRLLEQIAATTDPEAALKAISTVADNGCWYCTVTVTVTVTALYSVSQHPYWRCYSVIRTLTCTVDTTPTTLT